MEQVTSLFLWIAQATANPYLRKGYSLGLLVPRDHAVAFVFFRRRVIQADGFSVIMRRRVSAGELAASHSPQTRLQRGIGLSGHKGKYRGRSRNDTVPAPSDW